MAHGAASALSALLLAVTILAMTGCATHAPDRPDDARADRLARDWLALIDRGEYTRSWQQASKLFQREIARPAWVEAVEAARHGSGAPTERALISVARTQKLPDVPENDYVVLVYASRFDNHRAVQETVTLVREDEALKAAGYFLR